MKNRIAAAVRRGLLAVAGNVSLFVTTAFFVTGLLIMGPEVWWRERIDLFERYALIPWGMALCLLRLERRVQATEGEVRRDLGVLFVLLLWLIVPFALRFGNTFNNSGSWHNHIVLFFGVYAMTTEQDAAAREKLFDLAALLFAVCSFLLGAALLYCAATVQKFGEAEFAFGVCNGIHLCANSHYNTTGMITVCCALMALAGVSRLKRKSLRALCLASVVMMSVCTVLTQSRTARYALILAYAACVYSYVSANACMNRAVVRHAAGVLAACVVAAAGYGGASLLTDAAIAHYNRAAQMSVALLPVAYAEEEAADNAPAEAEGDQEEPEDAPQYEARGAGDWSFTGRTTIWRSLLNQWKENPKYLLIGYGAGRVGSKVDPFNRNGIAMHNTYLQFMADYGLIGFGLLCVFFAIVFMPVMRVFFARGGVQAPGYRALCGLVLASFVTGMMESAPLGAMTPMNMMLFYALALLYARGRTLKAKK